MIDSAFSSFRNFKYYLHAILMHEGIATHGHYYAYIFDQKS